MLLIIEIWLTVKAWRKGWKALALLPVTIGLVLGFLVGAAMEDADQAALVAIGLMLDFGLIATLIGMVRNAPAATPAQAEPISQPASLPAPEASAH